jgi:SNF2 family DNA or RNA helicase
MENDFENIVETRMQRFMDLIKHANLQFKNYQHTGVEWCLRNEIRPNPIDNIRGGFIADEMGLGKTIMMIGVMFTNFLPHTLIVVPVILLEQWRNEIFRITGHKAIVYHGSQRKSITYEKIQKSPIVITTYNILTLRDCILHKIKWNRIIHDEAHHLRNSQTRRYTASLRLRSRIRWLVSGTPIQNRVQDFFHLCNLIGFKSIDKDKTTKIIKHFVLRRTKADVGIKLTSVNKHDIIVPWQNSTEKNLAEEIHSLIPNITSVSSKHNWPLSSHLPNGRFILVAMLRARQSCIMSSLMHDWIQHLCSEREIPEEYINSINYTSKIDHLITTIIQRHDNGKGKIVFCHFRNEIDTIAQRLHDSGIKNVFIYDGRNSGANTLNTIMQFADIVILQIQTGCEGLNLQKKFSEIYFTTPHWNPFVEEQAIARCHRIGQQFDVDVFRFTMENFDYNVQEDIDTQTLENYINKIHIHKIKVANEILSQ